MCILVGRLTENRCIEIIGIGEAPSTGVKQGTIIDINSTVEAIKSARHQAELMSGYKIKNVFTGIADSQIKSFNDSGMWVLKGGPITQHDIDKALKNTERAIKIDSSRKLLEMIPQEYVIDQQRGIRSPLGKSGVRLEPKVHIITASANTVEDIKRCINKAGLELMGEPILEPLASGYAVLGEEETQVGVVMVDIGGGTTDMTIFHENSLIHSSVIPIAGNKITSDISHLLRVLIPDAEQLKKKHGYAISRMAEREEYITISTVGGAKNNQQVPSNLLSEIIQARVEQIFESIAIEMKKSGKLRDVSCGMVFTGGTSLLRGLKELAELYFEAPVRIGTPKNFNGLKKIVSSPVYSTAMGLVLYGAQDQKVNKRSVPVKGNGLVTKTKTAIKGLCDDYF